MCAMQFDSIQFHKNMRRTLFLLKDKWSDYFFTSQFTCVCISLCSFWFWSGWQANDVMKFWQIVKSTATITQLVTWNGLYVISHISVIIIVIVVAINTANQIDCAWAQRKKYLRQKMTCAGTHTSIGGGFDSRIIIRRDYGRQIFAAELMLMTCDTHAHSYSSRLISFDEIHRTIVECIKIDIDMDCCVQRICHWVQSHFISLPLDGFTAAINYLSHDFVGA